MEHTGFQNARGVTAFAVGMRICWCGIWYIVRFVHPNGAGLVTFEPDHVSSRVIRVTEIPNCILDLDSVWVERKCKGRVTKRECEIVLVSSEWIGFTGTDGQEGLCPRGHWDESYNPLPLPTVPDTGTGEWKPEAGKECFHDEGDKNIPDTKVIPVGPDPEIRGNWVCSFREESGQRRFYSYMSAYLNPLPPEPPVQVGDIWVDKAGPTHWFVNLTGENPWGQPDNSAVNWGGEGGPSVALNPACHQRIDNIAHYLIPRPEAV